MVIACYAQRHKHLDLGVVAGALVRHEPDGSRERGNRKAVRKALVWLHDEKGYRFTIEHMRAAVIGQSFKVIMKLRELGCPWDESVIPSMIRGDGAEEVNYGDAVNMEIMQDLLDHGCPIDITTCLAAEANPRITWAPEVLVSMDCPCGGELH